MIQTKKIIMMLQFILIGLNNLLLHSFLYAYVYGMVISLTDKKQRKCVTFFAASLSIQYTRIVGELFRRRI